MRRGGFIVGLIAAFAAAAAAQAPDSGDAGNDRARLISAKAAAAEAEAHAAALQSAAQMAETEADRARTQAAALALKVTAAEQDIAAAQARIALVTALQDSQRRRIAERQQPIMHLVAALQTMARRPAALAVAQPGSVGDLVHVRLLLADMLPVVAERTASVRADLARATKLRSDAEQARQALTGSRELLTRRRKEFAALEATAVRRSQQLSDEAASESERAIALGENARDIADRLQVQQDRGNVLARLAGITPPSPRAAGGDAAIPAYDGRPRYRLPVSGEVATGFGEVSDAGVRARGLTISASPNTAVVAPNDGTVLFARTFRSYGNVVILAHGGGWTTTITGIGDLGVKVGQRVVQGQTIGRAGPGRSDVTAELRRDGRAIDLLAVAQAG
jgi:murein hydrolase activator